MLSHNRPYRVLLVEDNLDQLALVERWLSRQLPCEITCAQEGVAGVAMAARGGWDIVVSDIELPNQSGIDVLRASKEQHPNTPALAMTAHRTVEATLDVLRARVDDVLFKPIDPKGLADRIDNLLRNPRVARENERVLAIGAHFDDVEIGCGGTLLRHARMGDAITSLVLTDGACGGDSGTRRREGERACRLLGADLRCASLRDTVLGNGPDTISAIARVIAEVRPTVVYTHSVHDTHQDHRATHQATLVAARAVPNLLCYESPSTTNSFNATRFVGIDEHLEGKLGLLRAYASQAGRPYLAEDVIRSTARYWGRFSGYGLVEALEVVRSANQDGL